MLFIHLKRPGLVVAIWYLLLLSGADARLPERESSHPISETEERHLQQLVQITRFALINADSNTEITTVNLGLDSIISLNALPSRNLNVVAITTGSITKVVFDLNGRVGVRTENSAPYSLCGDTGNPPDYNSCGSLVPGTHTITAKAFVGTTTVAASKTVSFQCKFVLHCLYTIKT